MCPPGFGPIGSAPISAIPDLASLVERGRRALEEYVGLPSGILTKIWDADDWTFVLQVHGLVEAAVDHLVASDIPEPTRAWVLTLDLQTGKGSKVQFGAHHGTLLPREVRFIRHLSVLRARYAHDIRMTSVPLTDCLQRRENQDVFNGLLESAFVDGRSPSDVTERRKWLSERPRDTLFIAVSDILGRAFDIKSKERHALRTEDGVILTTETGAALVDGAAPVRPPNEVRSGKG